MAKESKLKKYEDVLMSALKFSEADLAANEGGEYSAAQIEAMKKNRANQFVTAAIFGGVAAMFALFVTLVSTPLGVFVNGGAAILTMLFLLYATYNAIKITRDLKERKVAVTEGRIELNMTTNNNSATFAVNLDGKRFAVRKASFLSFKNGDPYRLYFAPSQKKILSVEWLRDDSPFEDELPARKHRIEDASETDIGDMISDDGERRHDMR